MGAPEIKKTRDIQAEDQKIWGLTDPPNLPIKHQTSGLVGGFNPFEKYSSNWIISPNRGENKKYLKPPNLRRYDWMSVWSILLILFEQPSVHLWPSGRFLKVLETQSGTKKHQLIMFILFELLILFALLIFELLGHSHRSISDLQWFRRIPPTHLPFFAPGPDRKESSSNHWFFRGELAISFRVALQGGPLPVISGVISPINGLING